MTLAQEKGASTWLTTLPIDEWDFALHTLLFVIVWPLDTDGNPRMHVPTAYACSKSISLECVLSCPEGGFPSTRHNEIHDVAATLLSEVCHNVAVEPPFYSLRSSNIEGGARLDIVQVVFGVGG